MPETEIDAVKLSIYKYLPVKQQYREVEVCSIKASYDNRLGDAVANAYDMAGSIAACNTGIRVILRMDDDMLDEFYVTESDLALCDVSNGFSGYD